MRSFNENLQTIIEAALQEDVGEGDHSTLSCIPTDVKGTAVLKIKQTGILAGMAVAEKIFQFVEPSCIFLAFKNDGDSMAAGQEAFKVSGAVHNILKCERIVLNCMQRMSGIATLTRQYVEKLAGYPTKILDTRKTTPGFRLLEKEAVRIGGGVNHRFGLYDMIMLKDNHIDFSGGIEQAIQKARQYVQQVNPAMQIEIETRTVMEVSRVVACGGVQRIMLDNFTIEQIREAMQIINGAFKTEASGGISLANIVDYADSGVDFISIGSLIHQARSLDMSLKALIHPS